MNLDFFAASYEVCSAPSAPLGTVTVKFADGSTFSTADLAFARIICAKAAIGYPPAVAIEAASQQLLNAAVQ
jgi:hypothetical protein